MMPPPGVFIHTVMLFEIWHFDVSNCLYYSIYCLIYIIGISGIFLCFYVNFKIFSLLWRMSLDLWFGLFWFSKFIWVAGRFNASHDIAHTSWNLSQNRWKNFVTNVNVIDMIFAQPECYWFLRAPLIMCIDFISCNFSKYSFLFY